MIFRINLNSISHRNQLFGNFPELLQKKGWWKKEKKKCWNGRNILSFFKTYILPKPHLRYLFIRILTLSRLSVFWTFTSTASLTLCLKNIILENHKQPSWGVLRKRCSENMQEIYGRTPMPKCGFNKVAKQLWNGCFSVPLCIPFSGSHSF